MESGTEAEAPIPANPMVPDPSIRLDFQVMEEGGDRTFPRPEVHMEKDVLPRTMVVYLPPSYEEEIRS